MDVVAPDGRQHEARRVAHHELNGVGDAGLFYGGGLHQLGVQALGIAVVAAFVFASSVTVFSLCKKTIGLRVSAQQELEGLDIHEHGMWGYPEQFMPVPGSEYHHPLAHARRAAALRAPEPAAPAPMRGGR